jgi:alanine dehydrogenase
VATPTDPTALLVRDWVAADAAAVFAGADMIVKVKEPQPVECAMLRPGQILYTYLHLAPDPEQTRALVASGAVCVAYETITGPGGGLPLLAPMSEVAGRMAVQAGAAHLEKTAPDQHQAELPLGARAPPSQAHLL